MLGVFAVMEVSRVCIELSSKDLLSIVEDFVDIKGLNITDIKVSKNIVIKGSYKLGAKVSFMVAVLPTQIDKDMIRFKVEEIKVGKIKIFNWIKNFAMKRIFNELKEYGLFINKDIVSTEYRMFFEKLPFYLYCVVHEINLLSDAMAITVENVSFSLDKNYKKAISQDAVVEAKIDIPKMDVPKVEDNYTKVREIVEDRVPDKYEAILKYAFILPDIIALFYRLFRDHRVPIKIKIIVGAVIAYLASPIDILPDFLPFIGQIDDIALAFYALNKIINEIPTNIIIENWQGEVDIILLVKEGVKYLNRVAGGTNIAKLFDVISKLSTYNNIDENNSNKDI